MNLFLKASTLGTETVPYFPPEIRHKIWMFSQYPKAKMWCSVCTATVLQELEDGTFEYLSSHYSVWDDVARCISCAGYPQRF